MSDLTDCHLKEVCYTECYVEQIAEYGQLNCDRKEEKLTSSAEQDTSALTDTKLSEAKLPEVSLRNFIEKNPDTLHQVIVEAVLPNRTIVLGDSQTKNFRLDKSALNIQEERQEKLEMLVQAIKQLGDGSWKITVLKSAGAITVELPARRVLDIAALDSVKAIRSNRKLKK